MCVYIILNGSFIITGNVRAAADGLLTDADMEYWATHYKLPSSETLFLPESEFVTLPPLKVQLMSTYSLKLDFITTEICIFILDYVYTVYLYTPSNYYIVYLLKVSIKNCLFFNLPGICLLEIELGILPIFANDGFVNPVVKLITSF